jgi:chemotaxis protein MotB
MRRKKREEENENLDRWLLTYSDLITLLLAFFVMLYVFSTQDKGKYNAMTTELKAIFSGGTRYMDDGGHTGTGTLESSSYRLTNEQIKKKLEEEIARTGDAASIQKNISIITDERGVVIRIMDQAFYDLGSADLKATARETLDKVAPVIKPLLNDIRIEGHTDNVPISTAGYRSNWELSVRRATEVVRYLIENSGFPPQRISAAGYAEYRPLVDNDSDANRATNRRIEIIVLNTSDKNTSEKKDVKAPKSPDL